MSSALAHAEAPADAELISAVRGGDVDAYGDLFERHVEAARRLARQIASAGDVDDLVSDAFAKVLGVLQRGGGPDVAFRAYLLTAVRRLHVDRIRAGKKVQSTDDLEKFDPGVPFEDTAVSGFENEAAAKAFASLPERWQLVLWHTEVEGQKPAEVGELLGMSANSVSALAYRAREGLRQAFLNEHAQELDGDTCRWVHQQVGAYVRGGTSRRDSVKVEQHLDECRKCMAIYLELSEVNSNLAGIIAPLLLGVSGAAYVAASSAAAKGGLILLAARAKDGLNSPGPVVGAGAAAAAAAVVVAGLMLSQSEAPNDRPEAAPEGGGGSSVTPSAPDVGGGGGGAAGGGGGAAPAGGAAVPASAPAPAAAVPAVTVADDPPAEVPDVPPVASSVSEPVEELPDEPEPPAVPPEGTGQGTDKKPETGQQPPDGDRWDNTEDRDTGDGNDPNPLDDVSVTGPDENGQIQLRGLVPGLTDFPDVAPRLLLQLTNLGLLPTDADQCATLDLSRVIIWECTASRGEPAGDDSGPVWLIDLALAFIGDTNTDSKEGKIIMALVPDTIDQVNDSNVVGVLADSQSRQVSAPEQQEDPPAEDSATKAGPASANQGESSQAPPADQRPAESTASGGESEEAAVTQAAQPRSEPDETARSTDTAPPSSTEPESEPESEPGGAAAAPEVESAPASLARAAEAPAAEAAPKGEAPAEATGNGEASAEAAAPASSEAVSDGGSAP